MSETGVPDHTHEIEVLLKTVKRLLTRCAVMVTVVFVIVVALSIQTQLRNKQLDRLDDSTKASQTASEKASQDLADAVEQSQEGGGNAAAAIQVIFDLRVMFCEAFPELTSCSQQPSE